MTTLNPYPLTLINFKVKAAFSKAVEHLRNADGVSRTLIHI